MAFSSPVDVTLDQNKLLAENASQSANSALDKLNPLYDPNLMSPLEKRNTTVQFAGMTSQYNVILARAKGVGIDTSSVETAYDSLSSIMSTVMEDSEKTTDIDRFAYKKALDGFNSELSELQNKLNSDFNSQMEQVSQATSQTSIAVSQANVDIASAGANAKTALENANSAVDSVKVVDSKVTTLAGGSTKTIADLENGIQSKISKTDLNGYATESEITQLSDDINLRVTQKDINDSNRNYFLNSRGDFLFQGTGTTNENTGEEILSLSTGDFKSSGITVDDSVSFGFDYEVTSGTPAGKIGVWLNRGIWSSDATVTLSDSNKSGHAFFTTDLHTHYEFLTINPTHGVIRLDNVPTTTSITVKHVYLIKGTTDLGWHNAPEEGLITQLNLSNETGILLRSDKISIDGETHITDGSIDVAKIGNLTADHIGSGTFKASVSMTAPKINGGTINGSDIAANTFSTPNGTFTVDRNGSVNATNLTLQGRQNYVYNSEALSNGSGWSFNGGYVTEVTKHDNVNGIGFNGSGSVNWTNFATSKMIKIEATGIPFSLSVWSNYFSGDSGAKAQAILAFFDKAGNRINGFRIMQTTSSTVKSWKYFSTDGYIAPSNAYYVAIQYWAYNGNIHIVYSEPMITQSDSHLNYTPDTGTVSMAGNFMLQNDGTLTTTYSGIDQDPDNIYHAWNLNTGQLTIGQGYISSVSSGNRTINNTPTEFTKVQGTLTASYLKFTNNWDTRVYLDAQMITLSAAKNDMIKMFADGGITVNQQAMLAPALTIKTGHLDMSSTNTYAQFRQILVGYSLHTFNSLDGKKLAFQKGRGNSGNYVNIKASGFDVTSQMSNKKQIRRYSDNGKVVANTDLATYFYKGDKNSEDAHMGPIIDNVNDDKEYYTSQEITLKDGTGIDTTRATFYGWSAIKALQRENEQLQIRLRKLEIEGLKNE